MRAQRVEEVERVRERVRAAEIALGAIDDGGQLEIARDDQAGPHPPADRDAPAPAPTPCSWRQRWGRRGSSSRS